MKIAERLELAEQSLNRVLEFFPRVDTKASFIAALNTGMLALIAINVNLEDVTTYCIAIPGGAAAILLFGSLFYVYKCQFPQLKGGAKSKVYFNEIAGRIESEFIDEFLAESEENYLKDILGQVWRNAEILKQKFNSMKTAFILTALAMAPWFVFLACVAALHSKLLLS